MAKEKEASFTLSSIDDIFSTQQMRDDEKREKIMEIPIKDLIDFHSNELGRQPYRVDERTPSFIRLKDSIAEFGVLQPLIVRPDKEHEGKYEVVGGMRRRLIGEMVRLKTLPVIIRELNDDEANIIVTDTNEYRDEEEILPSEKAWAYKIRLDAMKRQGIRTDLTCAPSEHKLHGVKSRDILAATVGESRDTIRRYIRLTELIPEILELVDEGKMALRPAVEISYLPNDLQEELFDNIKMEDCTPSHAQSLKMRKFYTDGKLTGDVISSIMQEDKPNQKEKIVLRDERIKRLIPDSVSISKREDYVIKALEHYSKYLERKREKER